MKKIIKSRVFAFVLGAIIFGSIGIVSAYSIFANDIEYTPKDTTWKKSNGEDITNVKDAIDELYSKADLADNYDNKTYIQDGISVYDDRVTILSGGYYVDSDNVTWVNLNLKFNKSLSSDDSWLLIYGLPNINKEIVMTDINNKYAFKLNSKKTEHQKSNISFMDYSQTSILKDEEITLQFKY